MFNALQISGHQQRFASWCIACQKNRARISCLNGIEQWQHSLHLANRSAMNPELGRRGRNESETLLEVLKAASTQCFPAKVSNDDWRQEHQ